MARGDFDTEHKADALRYCVVLGAVPYLDVDVASAIDLTSDEKKLTDIDVLGVQLQEDGSTRRLLSDCKGEKPLSKGSGGVSPISRSFWLAGLMTYVHAHEGFVILRRRAEKAHRLSAQTLNVRLFDKPSFSAYAAATNPEFHLVSSYAANTDAWYRLMEGVTASGDRHRGLWRQLSSEVPLARDSPRRFRRILAVVREHRGELDPSKPLHMALFTEAVLAASLLLSTMISQLRNIVELSDDHSEFSSVLRYYLWGGRDGYTMLQRMNELSGRAAELADFENKVVAWPHLVPRGLLEAPTSVRACCMPLRELSLRFVADIMPAADARLGGLFAHPRARQFANRVAAYLTEATRLPQDFPKRLSDEIDGLVNVADRPTETPSQKRRSSVLTTRGRERFR
jgi:hypothetical protein